ncbi:MAG: hypothetical protein H0W33_05275 [Gammaproteobacteria bacterium]|nr:hypothetical protein [Gammaproteobacteria bacterium]
MLECTRHLQPGVWLLREPSIAHHALVRHRPASLLDTKTLRRLRMLRAKRFVYRLLFMIIPPFVVFVGAGGKKQKANQPEAKFPILVLAKRGDAILIDHVRGEVVRLRKEPRTGTAELDVRVRLGRFLDVPALEIMDDGKVEREPYVDGQSSSRQLHMLASAPRPCSFVNTRNSPWRSTGQHLHYSGIE